MSVGEDVLALMGLLEKLYLDTGLEYFRHQAMSWSQWIWMLQDSRRAEWGLEYPGHPNGADVAARLGGHGSDPL